MNRKILLTELFLLAISFSVHTQPMVGFWTVNQVMVGDKNLTPVAKWFKYDKNQTYQAGNGWTQNDVGIWSFDNAKNEFLPESRNGKDKYGAFKVTFTDTNKMTWTRMEDGMKVVVFLSKIKAMPMSPKDSIAGNWELITVLNNEEDITDTYDPENNETILIRWTETYRKVNPDGSQSLGYWHMDAHEPELHMIDFQREAGIKIYEVSFKDDLVMMQPKKEMGTRFIYKRK